jgi:putative membrane protein
MAKPFLTEQAKRAFIDAVRDVEAVTSAELVVAVRARSGSYLQADLIAGILTGLAALAYLLFSHWEFALVWFVVDPILAGLLGGLAASRLPKVRRALTPPAVRRRQVEIAARALFLEKRVHGTAGRTGLLLYVSVLERDMALVPDIGLEALAATESWKGAVADLEAAVRRKEDGVQVAERVRTLAGLLGPALPRAVDDVDELANEVCE